MIVAVYKRSYANCAQSPVQVQHAIVCVVVRCQKRHCVSYLFLRAKALKRYPGFEGSLEICREFWKASAHNLGRNGAFEGGFDQSIVYRNETTEPIQLTLCHGRVNVTRDNSVYSDAQGTEFCCK
jgi:hypothetical protein